MKYLLILSILISCGSKNPVNQEQEKVNNDKFLLSLKKEKTKEEGKLFITTYEKSQLIKVLNKEDGSLQFKFGNKKILSTNKECLILVEIYDKRFILLSSGSSKNNISAAGPENFERNQIYIVDNSNGEILKCELAKSSYFKMHKSNLNSNSTQKNTYAISQIDFKNRTIVLEIDKNVNKTIKLESVILDEFQCD
jgi:hypothetical protein